MVMGHVIRMDSVSKSDRRDWEAEASLCGFTKACAIINQLSGLRTCEQRTAVENWSASECGKITAEEKAVLEEFYGWRRT
jgi:hypothetical protein